MQSKPTLCAAIHFSEKIIREAGTGKLTIINSFHSFQGAEFPLAIPEFVVTAAFTNLSGKLDSVQVSLELVDQKDEPVFPPISGEFGSDVDVTPDEVFDLSFLVSSCTFEKEGVYQARFRIGDEILGRRSLPARLLPSAKAVALPAPAAGTSKTQGSGKSSGRRSP